MDATVELLTMAPTGGVEIGFAGEGERTRLAHLWQAAPLRVLFPDEAGEPLPTAAIVNTGGGIVGGDRLRLAVDVAARGQARVIQSAAEKVYRSKGPEARVATTLTIGAGAWLEWLPQETILFDGARLRRHLNIEIAPGGRLLAAEMLIFGRLARGERFERGLLHDAWEIREAGRLIWADALHLAEPGAALARVSAFAGATTVATLVYCGPDAAAQVTGVRAVAAQAGVTLLGSLLLARWVDRSPAQVRRQLAAAVIALRVAAGQLPAALPRLWLM